MFASIIARLMNRHNAKMNAFAIDQLNLAPGDHVLEIGFGGGLNLSRLIASAGFVAGVDRSSAMVQRARAHFRDAISNGRADFREGSIEALPFEAASFDKVCTVNTIYFWISLDAGFTEIHRVMSQGGRAAVGFLPKEHMDRMGMPTDIFKTRGPEDVIAGLEFAGFSGIRIERPKSSTPWNVVTATR
jgi:ubiquinone/menaquinone biosynthesis C-methylase UbiE